MKKVLVIIILFQVSVVICQVNQNSKENKQAKQYDAETFFKPPEQTTFRISPDGNHLAYVGKKENKNNIFIRKIGENQGICITNFSEDFRGVSWGNNDYILYLQDDKGDENYKIFRVNIHNGEIKCLTDYKRIQASIVNNPQTDAGNIVITMNLRDSTIFDPYRLNIITGELEMLYKNTGSLSGWMADNSGVIRFAQSDKLLYRKDNKSDFREIMPLTSAADYFSVIGFTWGNDHIYAYSNINRDKVAIVEFDPDEGKEIKVLYENRVYDAFGDDERDYVSYSAEKKKILYAQITEERRKLIFFDKQFEKIYTGLKKKIGNKYDVNITSRSNDFKRLVLQVSSDKLEGIAYFYDGHTGKIEKLSEGSQWLDENEMADVIPVSFKSRDGVTIHGYLTMPKGIALKNMPVVVNPHAGPQWRNSWIFDENNQFLANRGYAVFQVNQRGSTGYGKAFQKAGYAQWGLRMQDDITDGVNWLIKKGIADKRRIAIWGWSAGGYAALAGVTFTPDLYACGIDMWGISDWFLMYKSFPPQWRGASTMKKIVERWGDIKKDSVKFYNVSPVFHADKIKAPLLIIQGMNDVRVKKGQSDEMAEALKKYNKEFEYILIKDIGHGITDEEMKIKQMKKMEEFLDKYIGKKAVKTKNG